MRAAPAGCEGCGECCRGMGESVVLDPYDAHMLENGLGRPFASLINREVGLAVGRGLILPHLLMKGEWEACGFLGSDGRCGIHEFRPGICRLYPLARRYGEKGVTYFAPEGNCPGRPRTKVRVSRWLGIPDLLHYEAFKAEWFAFTSRLQEVLENEEDPNEEREINRFVLENCYLRSTGEEDFFAVFGERMERIRRVVRF